MDDDNYNYEDVDDIQEALDRTPVVVLLIVATVSFYFLALVTEERFVPALNVIAKRLRIPDDVAGATLMAAGASAPELFANIVSMFITHSALGMGTIVGSEIFNQFVICGGAIFASKNKKLKLDPFIVIRDVIFYFISLMILFWTLSDRKVDENNGELIVYVCWYHGAALLACYIIYVCVCANFNRWFGSAELPEDDNSMFYEAFEVIAPTEGKADSKSFSEISDGMPFVREPPENFHLSVDSSKDRDIVLSNSSILTELVSFDETEEGILKTHMGCIGSCSTKSSMLLLDKFAPTANEVEHIEVIESNDNCLGLHLWQRSAFYDKAKIDMNAWQLRWIQFKQNKILCLPQKRESESDDDNIFMLPLVTNLNKDNKRLLLKIATVNQEEMIFLAPTDAIFEAAVRQFEEFLEIPQIEMMFSQESISDHEFHESLLAFPEQGTLLQKILHLILFPVKAVIHFGIPDVRYASFAPNVKASLAAFASVLFLICGSFVMVESLESLAHELHIPAAVVGATLSAAGTSLPSYVASQVAARQGLGNMAISNMLGSNTFNILIALGLPWFVYTIMHGGHYTDLPVQGIDESILVMALGLLLFIFLIYWSNFKLFLWHAYLFFILYAIFVMDYLGRCFG